VSGRAALWGQIDVERHLALIDDDLDKNDDAHQRMVGELRAALIEVRTEMKAGFVECENRDKGNRRLLVGLLVSIVASSVGIMFTVLIAGAA
jgi:hypothetical protein